MCGSKLLPAEPGVHPALAGELQDHAISAQLIGTERVDAAPVEEAELPVLPLTLSKPSEDYIGALIEREKLTCCVLLEHFLEHERSYVDETVALMAARSPLKA